TDGSVVVIWQLQKTYFFIFGVSDHISGYSIYQHFIEGIDHIFIGRGGSWFYENEHVLLVNISFLKFILSLTNNIPYSICFIIGSLKNLVIFYCCCHITVVVGYIIIIA